MICDTNESFFDKLGSVSASVLRKDVEEDVFAALRQLLRELDVEIHDQVAPLRGLLRKREAVTLEPFDRRRFDDFVKKVESDLLAVQGRDLSNGAAEGLLQGQAVLVADVGAVSSESVVRLVPNDEGDVGRNFARNFVASSSERDLRSRFPTGFDRDREDLFLVSLVAHLVEDGSRYFHLLFDALCDVFERDKDLFLDGGVLLRLLDAARERVRPERSSGVVVAAAAAEQLFEVDVHAFDATSATPAPAAAAAEEHLERIRGS